MTDAPNEVPADAICDVCKKPIGMLPGCVVQAVDEKTDECVGPLIWFHKACLNLPKAN